MQFELGLCALLSLGGVACGSSPTKYERKLVQVHADSSRTEAKFAAHFSSDISSVRIKEVRSDLQKKSKPKFEFKTGPRCIRMYWGDITIDSSYYVYFTEQDGNMLIDRIDSGGSFGQSMGAFGRHSSGRKAESPHNRCKSLNGL